MSPKIRNETKCEWNGFPGWLRKYLWECLWERVNLKWFKQWQCYINEVAAAAAAKSLQSCPTLCDPIDGSPPGSPIPGILQPRTLEWVAISFSNAWKWKWSRSVVSDPQQPHGLQPTRLLRPWVFPGRSTGVGCHCLLRYQSLGECKCNSTLRYLPKGIKKKIIKILVYECSQWLYL